MGGAWMNKRGDIPTFMVFVCAITLSIIALWGFFGFANDGKKILSETSELSNKIDFMYYYIINTAETICRETISGFDARELGDFMIGVDGATLERFRKISSDWENNVSRKNLMDENSGNFFAKIRNKEFKFNVAFGGANNANKYVFKADNLFVIAKSGESEIVKRFDLIIEFDSSGKVIRRKTSPALGRA